MNSQRGAIRARFVAKRRARICFTPEVKVRFETRIGICIESGQTEEEATEIAWQEVEETT